DRELARFARISMGSSSELECQLRLARDLKYLDEETYASLLTKLVEVRRLLRGFLHRLTSAGEERQKLRSCEATKLRSHEAAKLRSYEATKLRSYEVTK